jgi:AraC family transcriptional regulator of adaptative response/methylated-DNA-[protein]-cysteine methyltransferase
MTSDYQRIGEAIRYLEAHFQEQPGLDEVAQHVGLSPYHFQRLFKRWAGISPKRFVQFLTVEYAKGLLEESHTVLDAAFEAGLSGPGRMHDLFVTVDAVTPGEFRAQGAGLRIDYGIHASPFGECLLAATERGVCGLSFITNGDRGEVIADLQRRWPEAELFENGESTRPMLDRIFPAAPGGQRHVTLFLRGTNFQIQVWQALLKIPPGFVCAYEDIARAVGRPPGAARAIGNAVGANPVSYIIPCHRVIQKMGVTGNYRWNPIRKKAMLAWEAAHRRGDELEDAA